VCTRPVHYDLAIKLQHIEHDEGKRDVAMAVQESLADERKVRHAIGERDELTAEDAVSWQIRKLRKKRGHVPAAARADPEVALARDQRTETAPLQLKRVVARRERPGPGQHWLWQPQGDGPSL